MALLPHERARVLAVLGPTNTGKTHFAVERMLAHRSGLIGFPLRLLAREIYDRIVVEKGAALAALITGEERIQPPTARYFVATVEAMPSDLDVGFLAIDEIQLCADPERGHIFTDRLLHARGSEETMFLGADTIRPLLKLLVPEAEVVTRPRFSTLTYTPPAKVTRLPRRSAVVAFTAQDVYAFAELVRRRRGGAAVVLGALSPRTRNAQVALYQAGEVDYLIATDAIGMGLNMDLHHVALASIDKFDGRERRPLHAHEIGQIAGRAGRHMQDGTFGTTQDVGGLDARIVESVETHSFPAIRQIYWRNDQLDFDSLTALQDSLDASPPLRCLSRTGDALDHVSLKILARRPRIRERVTTRDGVRLLWSVCQIPDFRKTLTDAHMNLLDTVFEHLAARDRLPTDWVADQIARLQRTDGDIDALITRLAHIRTWTYVAYRDDWLASSSHWQERARAVEDQLSDALHERLTQRFIDRRTQALLKSLQQGGPIAAVEKDGAILVDGHPIGRIDGLRYELEPSSEDAERKALGAAARRVLGPEIQRRARTLIAAADQAFTLDSQAQILWRQDKRAAPIARLLPGPAALTPRLEPLLADSLSGQAREAVRKRVAVWLDGHLASVMLPLRRLQAAGGLAGAGRGLCFLLVEGLGNVRTAEGRSLLNTLSAADRARLGKLGVRFGVRQIYLPAMIKPRAIELRARLWSTHRRVPLPSPPTPGAVTFVRSSEQPQGFAEAIGYETLGTACVRIDIVERLAARLRALARQGPFTLRPELMAMTGLGAEQLAPVVEALGFARDGERYVRAKSKPRRRTEPRRKAESHSPFADLRKMMSNS